MEDFMQYLQSKNPGEPEFHQAVEGFLKYIKIILDQKPEYRKAKIMERLTEPDRTISFRVNWIDNQHQMQVNKGFRVQMNSLLGPYKGGLRFHPTVNQGILKFLAFEQVFKNALTGLPMGGAKGGADFNPKGKSDREVMEFCRQYMQELHKYIGKDTDIPAGDIGVGQREIGYLFGVYKRIKTEFTGVLTGKGVSWGGSLIRKEATGYGLIHFARFMLQQKNQSLEGKRCLVSGAGNVSLHAVEKIIDFGGIPITVSDSQGFIVDYDGINQEKLNELKKIKLEQRGAVAEYIDKYNQAEYYERKDGHSPDLWEIKADYAFPCATQNEIDEKAASSLIGNNIKLLAEGANMPLTRKALEKILSSKMLYAPGIASNAGGVAVSGLEMAQNHIGVYWDKEELEERLKKTMQLIHNKCLQAASDYGQADNYYAGAIMAGFLKVADAMLDQGLT